MATDWFRAYYGDDYAASVRDVLSPERTRREVDFLVEATGIPEGASIVDLGCGEGRHALEFARRGHRVVAIDLNPEFLARGRSQTTDHPNTIHWVCDDMRVPQPGTHDLVLLLFHSFGFFSDAENLELLRTWRRGLAACGGLVIDVWNRERILGSFIPHAEHLAHGGLTVVEDRKWDASTRRLHVRYTYRWEHGSTNTYDASFRLYGKEELESLLREAGLSPCSTYGSLAGEAWAAETPRLVVVARAASIP